MSTINNDALAFLPRDGAEITSPGVCVPALQAEIHPYLVLASELNMSVPVCEPSLQGTAIPSNTMILAQAFDERRPLASSASVHVSSHSLHSMLPHINSLQPQLNLQVPTMEPWSRTQQHVYQYTSEQHLIQQIQLQIQHLQWRLAYLQERQHVQQLTVPQVAHPLQQHLLPQQFVPMENGPQSWRLQWVAELGRRNQSSFDPNSWCCCFLEIVLVVGPPLDHSE
ncbi:MAG: hypothetical protein J3Q66DRAFT_367286 [Benniella sp.]|nr:MAG: hypothetical protein J3Q66DRAFT_367286 [Benniella sp.]